MDSLKDILGLGGNLKDFLKKKTSKLFKRTEKNVINPIKQKSRIARNTVSGLPKATNTYVNQLVNDKRNILPYLNTSKDKNLAQTGAKELFNLGAGVVNRVATEAVIKPTYDLGTGIGSLNGKAPTRDSFKSGAFRAGAGLTADEKNYSQIGADLAQAVMPILEAWSGGKAKTAVESKAMKELISGKFGKDLQKQALRKMAVESSKVMGKLTGAFSGLQGLIDNKDKSITESVVKSGLEAVAGYAGGRVLGLAIPYVGKEAGTFAGDIKRKIAPAINKAVKYKVGGKWMSIQELEQSIYKKADATGQKKSTIAVNEEIEQLKKSAEKKVLETEEAFKPNSVTGKILQKTENTPIGMSILDTSKIDAPQAENALADIFSEFDIAEAGKRLMNTDGEGYITGFQREGSKFPKWIPEHLRSKPLMDRVIKYFNVDDLSKIETPPKNNVKQRELFDVVAKEIEERTGQKLNFVDDAAKAGEDIKLEDIDFPDIRKSQAPKTAEQIIEETRGGKINSQKPGENISTDQLLLEGSRPLELPRGVQTAKTKAEAKRFFKKGSLGEVKIEQPQSKKVVVAGEGGAKIGNQRNIASTANAVQRGKMGQEYTAEFTDISPTGKGFKDIFRNVEKFFGADAPKIKKDLLEPFNQAKKEMYENLDKHAVSIKQLVARGFKKGSEMSADLQRFGEGNLTEAALLDKYGPVKYKDFIKADTFLRKQYNKILDELNVVRAGIYPNQPDKIIPRRDDYYRHFIEMKEGFAGLKNIFDSPSGVPNTLAGASQFTKPKSKWLSLAQERLGNKTDEDAVGGFMNYVESAEYSKKVDPFIEKIRNLQKFLEEKGSEEGKDFNNMVEFLQDYADDLSGKTNPLDRGIQKYVPGGRKTFSVASWLNNRVKANVILGNASSSMAQIMNVPQGIASAGEKNFKKGVVRLAKEIMTEDTPMSQSPFIKERYFNTMDQFNEGIMKYPKKAASWMITVFDELGTKAIWNAHYEKALTEKIANPVNYADELTRKMVAGRGIGEVPIAQKSKIFQLVAPFQLEVANAWSVMGEFAGKKEGGKIMKMFLYTFLFNKAIKKIRGSDVAFDPINSLIEGAEAFRDENDKGVGLTKFAGRQAGEVLSNVPLGQTAASLYPEYGFNVGDKKTMTREELFGEGDPTRFGGGLLVSKGLQDPLTKVLPPLGGMQMKRTFEGIKSQLQGSVETKGGRTMFPITETGPVRSAQRAIFGKYSTPEAQEYFNKERSPLGDVQTEKFNKSGDSYYDKVMGNRAAGKEADKIKENSVYGGEIALDDDTNQLSNGKFYVESLDKTFDTKEKAAKASAKARFDTSGDVNDFFVGYGVEKYSKPNEESGIGQFTFEKEKAMLARNIMDGKTTYSEIPEDSKPEIYAAMGLDQHDVEYDYLANQPSDAVSQYMISEFSQAQLDHDSVIRALINGRRASISGKMQVSNAVVDDMYKNNLITSSEKKALKKIKLGANGEQQKTSSSSNGRKKSISALVTALKNGPKGLGEQDISSDGGGAQFSAPKFSNDTELKTKTFDVAPLSIQDLIRSRKTPRNGANIAEANALVSSASQARPGGSNTKLSTSFYKGRG